MNTGPRCTTAQYYYLSFRKPIDTDVGLLGVQNEFPTQPKFNQGVSIHTKCLAGSYANLSFLRKVLVDGEIFQDSLTAITIRQLDRDSLWDWIKVEVVTNQSPLNQVPVAGDLNIITPCGEVKNFTLPVQDTDGPGSYTIQIVNASTSGVNSLAPVYIPGLNFTGADKIPYFDADHGPSPCLGFGYTGRVMQSRHGINLCANGQLWVFRIDR